ncbi:MAG: penicillin acylase family protein [Solirubrobacterales bacterium]
MLTVGALLALAPATAHAVPPPAGAYQQDDYAEGNSYNIVPPGQNGGMNAAEALEFGLNGTRPAHQADQQAMYGDLVYTAPNLAEADILDFFKDASFGVEPGNVESTYGANCAIPPAATAPVSVTEECDDFTVVRDQFGIPHVYGDGREGLMFGLGYVTGEDRMVLADALRNTGRSALSEFAGGANTGQDHDTFSNAPYMGDDEFQLQFDRADELYDEEYDGLGTLVQNDVTAYTAGMNQYIGEARADPLSELDVVYPALGHPAGPEPWKVTDVIATGALVAGIFGKGGGGEVGAATSLQRSQQVFGNRDGKMIWKDFRSADDPEAPRTVHRGRFPYRQPPAPGKTRGLAMPDPGSVSSVPVVEGGARKVASEPGSGKMRVRTADGESGTVQAPVFGDILKALREADGAASNALLVSARESEGGHPTAVFGPQTSYFAPQLLMEQDAHAPSGPEGPGIDARGVSFVGTNLYVQLGRGQDYSFSATSAGNDITDTYSLRLCEPGGDEAIGYSGYRWNGECVAIEVIKQENSWTPNAADMTPPGSETLQAFRTNAGLITHLGTIRGKDVAYTKLRATYFHEVDSAGAFAAWNSPEMTQSADDFIEHAFKNDLTFNWFYADDEEIAYVNSGANPKRPSTTSPDFPVRGKPKYMWREWDPELATFKREPIERRPQVIDQRFLSSWNNKQARGYRGDGIRDYTSVYRVDMLDDRIKQEIRSGGKMSLVELINAMEDAGTVDLRGSHVVPWALKLIGNPSDPEQAAAADLMRDWVAAGAHRRDMDDSGAYDHAEAVKTMDAWWPLWIEAQFKPSLGELHGTFIGSGGAIHDAPRAQGSAFQGVVYGFAEKDLRSALGEPVRGAYSRTYCGEGSRSACRTLLRETLEQAAAKSFDEVYGTDGCTFFNGTAASPQMCGDAVDSVDLTVAAVPKFHWINRPTFQQAVQYTDGR